MRTTVRLSDALLDRARSEAGRRGTTLTALIEEGLELVLSQVEPESERPRIRLPVSKAEGGVLPGVDLDRTSDLLEIMDGRA